MKKLVLFLSLLPLLSTIAQGINIFGNGHVNGNGNVIRNNGVIIGNAGNVRIGMNGYSITQTCRNGKCQVFINEKEYPCYGNCNVNIIGKTVYINGKPIDTTGKSIEIETKKDVREYPFNSRGTLNIDNSLGSITVKSHTEPILKVERTLVTEKNCSLPVDISIEKGQYATVGFKTLVKCLNQVDYTVYAPQNTTLAKANSDSDDIVVENIKTMNADTVSGSINVTNAESANLESQSGDIMTKDVKIVNANSMSGKIKLLSVEQAKATSMSGNIKALFTMGAKDSYLKSMSGNVKTFFPAIYTGPIAASTMTGKVRSDFPLVSGKFAKIMLETMSGNISAKKSSN